MDDLAMVTAKELLMLRESCMQSIREGELYQLRNDAKLRAVNTTQSYDEFKDIVDAAHLRPITQKDKADAKTKSRLWNSAARQEY
ncbi:coiled-coil domain-containing protein 103 [Scaptodrosophila lebanonensis]|uniref:Coiled-coil domain-containing protein 103 n=1 Tax=Drosophila lebanonensis TaxID=7225 RepID=A0A6J2UJM9_DROLE|nr:coiled-coil domain-containing protein 103 [Scaptodrosophila lebanonensis]